MHDILILIYILLPLIFAPILGFFSDKSPFFSRWLTFIIALIVVFLIVFHVIPDCFHVWGLWSLLVVAFGFVCIQVGSRFYGSLQSSGKQSMLIFVAGFLCVHGLLDGAAMRAPALPGALSHHHELVWGVVLHRFVVASFIWVSAKRISRSLAPMLLTILGLATVLGWWFGGWVSSISPGSFVLIEGFVAGGLLHMIRDTSQLPLIREKKY